MKRFMKNMRNAVHAKTLSLFKKITRQFSTDMSYIALGGSLAMRKLGLIDRPASDLDLMVSEKAEKFIQFAGLMWAFQPNTEASQSGYNGDKDLGVKKYYSFRLLDTKVCVFIFEHADWQKKVVLRGIGERYVDPKWVLSVKKRYVERIGKRNKSYNKHIDDIRMIEARLKAANVIA